MKNKKAKQLAITISLCIHIVFLLYAFIYKLPNILAATKDEETLFHIKISPQKSSAAQKTKNVMTFESKKELSTQKVEMPKKETFKPAINEKPKASSHPPVFDQPISVVKKDNLYNVKKFLGEISASLSPHQRSTDQPTSLAKNFENKLTAVSPDNIITQDSLNQEFVDRMPGFTPQMSSQPLSSSPSQGEINKFPETYLPVITKKKDVGSFVQDLFWNLETYQDPKDGQKYFKISFRANPQIANLATVPKEIVILIDCSISIEPERLQEFKEGVNYILTHLNKDDLFNLIAFKEKTAKFQPEAVPATEANIRGALGFLEFLQASEKTDTYSALYKTIKDPAKRSPSYILLVSDGLPTEGVTNSQELIYKTAQVNKGKTSIFAFSGGTHVNRYLLDFISYKNRGWSEYSFRAHYINKNLSQMYDKIRDPIILNIRYFISGLDEQTFPKILPDFFRNTEFVIYGQYDTQSEFVLQLLGDVDGATKEFFVQGNFAQASQGTEAIAKNWAYNKIYHLISELEYNKDNKELLQTIAELSAKFKITTPYKIK